VNTLLYYKLFITLSIRTNSLFSLFNRKLDAKWKLEAGVDDDDRLIEKNVLVQWLVDLEKVSF
jgi:hypothetical protein